MWSLMSVWVLLLFILNGSENKTRWDDMNVQKFSNQFASEFTTVTPIIY